MDKNDFLIANEHIQSSNEYLKKIKEKHGAELLHAAYNQLGYAGCSLGNSIENYFKEEDKSKCSSELEESRKHTYRAKILATEIALKHLLGIIERYINDYTVTDLGKADISLSVYYDTKSEANNLIKELGISNEDNRDKNVSQELADQYSSYYATLASCVNDLAAKEEFLEKIKKENKKEATKTSVRDAVIKYSVKYGFNIAWLLIGLVAQGYFNFFKT